MCFFFFFQAEDGIRDDLVTGVQTCALPICDQLLRRFLGPKILESLYVLGEERTLPLFEELLVTGHTDPDMDRCEVTRALVAVRRLTGRVGRSSKFADGDDPAVLRTLDDAARYFDEQRDRLVPVVVI